MQTRKSFSLFLLSLTAGLANVAWAYPEYRVTVVAPANSAATDINGDGVVVGNYRFSAASTHAFLNRNKRLVDLGTVGGTASDAVAINDMGQVLGHWSTSSGQKRGFIYYRGQVRDIGIVPGRVTTFSDINNGGFITGYTLPDSTYVPRGFLRTPCGTFRDIGALPFDNPITYAFAINKHNQITGASGPLVFPDQPLRAFIWAKGVMRDLGDLGFAPNYGQAINDHGQITGSASLPQGFRNRHAFLYSNGRMVDIDGRPPTTERSSEGTGINIRGHIVGNSNHLSGFVYRGKRMQSLNALIAPGSGWDIDSPQAINDAGQIAATATRGGVRYAVRLDLIRPLPALAAASVRDFAAAPLATGDEQSQSDAEAQGCELVQPVKQ